MGNIQQALWLTPAGNRFSKGRQEDAHEALVSYVLPALAHVGIDLIPCGALSLTHPLVVPPFYFRDRHRRVFVQPCLTEGTLPDPSAPHGGWGAAFLYNNTSINQEQGSTLLMK